MKVAFVNQPTDAAILPVESGSMAIWTYQVARRLAKSCDVIVYARRGPNQENIEYDQGVQYRRISVDSDRVLRGVLKLFAKVQNFKWTYFGSIWYHFGYALKIANDLRLQQCDIVHIHHFSQFVPIIRAINPQIKIVLHMHGDGFSPLNQRMVERRLCQANLVLGCSEHIAEKIRIGFPNVSNRIQALYNGVDVNHFLAKNSHEPKIPEKTLLFVGRVSPEKGVHVLVDAFKKVVETCPDVKLKIVGPKVSAPIEFILPFNQDTKVEDLASFFGGNYISQLSDRLPSSMESQVVFTGNIPHSKLIDYYQDADIFIFPSVWSEPFGIPLVEAMATGLPVVATQGGGITEIVEEGRTGLLVERGEASALANAILRLLSDEDLRKSMGKAGRQRAVEVFSWDQIVVNLLNKYKNMS